MMPFSDASYPNAAAVCAWAPTSTCIAWTQRSATGASGAAASASSLRPLTPRRTKSSTMRDELRAWAFDKEVGGGRSGAAAGVEKRFHACVCSATRLPSLAVVRSMALCSAVLPHDSSAIRRRAICASRCRCGCKCHSL